MRRQPKQTVTCPKCHQQGNAYPGFRLSEYENLEGVSILNDSGTGTEDVPKPQKLTCNNCGHSMAVARGSIEVVKP